MKKAIGLFLVLMTFPALGLADEARNKKIKELDETEAKLTANFNKAQNQIKKIDAQHTAVIGAIQVLKDMDKEEKEVAKKLAEVAAPAISEVDGSPAAELGSVDDANNPQS